MSIEELKYNEEFLPSKTRPADVVRSLPEYSTLVDVLRHWASRKPIVCRTVFSILKAYGAEIDYVSEPDPLTGEYLPARIARVRELLKTIPNSYWPDQYSNHYNFKAITRR